MPINFSCEGSQILVFKSWQHAALTIHMGSFGMLRLFWKGVEVLCLTNVAVNKRGVSLCFFFLLKYSPSALDESIVLLICMCVFQGVKFK